MAKVKLGLSSIMEFGVRFTCFCISIIRDYSVYFLIHSSDLDHVRIVQKIKLNATQTMKIKAKPYSSG